LRAQTPGFLLTTIPTGVGPQKAGVADFNRDGTPDILSLNSSGSSMTVLLGNGDGTFQPGITTSLGAYPQAFAIGDLNSDGIPDAVTNDADNNQIYILLGNEDGTFGKPVILSDLSGPFVLGDFNSDGKLDLALLVTGSLVSIYSGNGDGTFGSPFMVQIPSGDYRTFSTADVNRDGNPDFVLGLNSDSGGFLVILGNGDGTFHAQGTYPNAGGGFEPSTTIGDVNGDGIPDVVMGGGNIIGISLGKGDGTFLNGNSYQTSPYIYGVTVGDVNGDGKADLIAAISQATASTSYATVLLGNGDGTFSAPVNIPTGFNPESIAVADFNRDGRLDLLTADQAANGVSVLINTGMTTCIYSVDLSLTVPVPAAGGNGTATVTTPSTCSWSASSSDSWLSPGQPTQSQGNGYLLISVASNTQAGSRTGTLTIAGQDFPVSQYGTTCVYSFSGAIFSSALTSATVASAGVTTTVAVSASASTCNWTASSSSPWITLGSGSGVGNGTISITFAPNTTGSEVQGSFEIAGQTFQVTQLDDGQNFTDVLPSDYYFTAVNLLLSTGVTSGCSANPPLYCPTQDISRDQMAVFLVRTILGTGTFPMR
jgi:hypothetical protein